jgi:hypothetical protein
MLKQILSLKKKTDKIVCVWNRRWQNKQPSFSEFAKQLKGNLKAPRVSNWQTKQGGPHQKKKKKGFLGTPFFHLPLKMRKMIAINGWMIIIDRWMDDDNEIDWKLHGILLFVQAIWGLSSLNFVKVSRFTGLDSWISSKCCTFTGLDSWISSNFMDSLVWTL